MTTEQPALSGVRVLVTGGTGFIGGRLVERLVLEQDARVRVLVRDLARVPRIARFPIEMIYGDVTNRDDVARAVDGCEVVFHCAALGSSGSEENRRLVNVEGTRNVLDAALHAHVQRVVHLSSMAVYGFPPDGDLDETAPRHYTGNAYSDTKLEGEAVALGYVENRGLRVAVIQPAIVYGPYGGYWTTHTLERLKTERVTLVNNGDGFCNAVYVDDVVNAVMLAAVKEQAVGEAFLISGEQPVTWRGFFTRYAQMLGSAEMVSLSATELLAAYDTHKRRGNRWILGEVLSIWRETPIVRQRLIRTREAAIAAKVARSLLPRPVRQLLKKRTSGISAKPRTASKGQTPSYPMIPSVVRFYVPKSRVRIEKAKRILGYQPVFDLESGMRLTEQWARWANLL